MSKLLTLALAPILICLSYIYFRDKYEKEPWRLLILGLVFGVVITFPIIQIENMLSMFQPIGGRLIDALYPAFCIAALAEEGMKFIVLFFLTWRNKNLNERFDGIVYAVFISLGFAGFENVLYVFNPDMGGVSTALMRAVISVPGHAFFGVTMGYHFTLAKFEPKKRTLHIIMAFVTAYLIHGIYDFILLSDYVYLMAVFAVFLIWLWINGFKKMKKHIDLSPFKKRREEAKLP